MSLLSVNDLSVAFNTRDGEVTPLSGVSFDMERGEILGLVGETGSGKSVTAQAVMGLLPFLNGRVAGGSITFMGKDLGTLSKDAYQKIRGNQISLIPQNPMTSLDPVYTVGRQIMEGLKLHTGLSGNNAVDKAVSVMTSLGIPNAAKVFHQYPHQLSGGLKQRIVIAMGLCGDPKLLIADEPTTALDVTVQAQIVALFQKTVTEQNVGLIMITHDLGVIANLCHRVAVMYAGALVETGPVSEVFKHPCHPYTRSLINCIPKMGMAADTLTAIPGNVPSVRSYPDGCRYHPRCENTREICCDAVPQDRLAPSGSRVRCHNLPSGKGEE